MFDVLTGSVKPNHPDPVQPISSKELGPNLQTAPTSASGTAFLNQTQTNNTGGFKQVKGPQGPQDPLLRSTSPFPGVFIPGPRSTSPPRDLRKLIHPESLRSHPLESLKNQDVMRVTETQNEIIQREETQTQLVNTQNIKSEQVQKVYEVSTNANQNQVRREETKKSDQMEPSKLEEQNALQEMPHRQDAAPQLTAAIEENIEIDTNSQVEIQKGVTDEEIKKSIQSELKTEAIEISQNTTESSQITETVSQEGIQQVQRQEVSETVQETVQETSGAQIQSTQVKAEVGNEPKQLNLDEEIENIDSEIQSLTREIESQEIFDSLLSEENKFIREQIPPSIVTEIIEEELKEVKRLELALKEQEDKRKAEEKTRQQQENEKIRQVREREDEEQRKKEEYQRMLHQQEHLKLTPLQIQAKEEKHKMKLKHIEETRALQTIHAEEMRKLKTQQAQETADLTLRQQRQNKTLSQQQMTAQLEEMTYLQKLQKQKLGQEQFLQQQRLRQKQKEEEKILQVKLDDLDFAIQEEFIRQQEEEKRLLEQKRYEEEMRRIKEEQERLLQLQMQRDAELKIEKEKFLQQIYKEQCMKMIKETGVLLTAEEMVEFILGLGIEISLDQVEKFSIELQAEHEAAQNEEKLKRERKISLPEVQKKINEEPPARERKVSVPEKPRKISRTDEIPEIPKFKDEAEAEEYVHQKTLEYKQQLEQKQAEEKQIVVEQIIEEPVPVEPTEIAEEPQTPQIPEEQREKAPKPASKVPGAVPIFGGSLVTSKSSNNVLLHEEMQKRAPQKVEKQENEVTEGEPLESGVVYESKPFKDLVETFEGNSRPVTKVKHITENPDILRSLSGVDINESIHSEISQQKTETFYDAQCSTENKLYTQETSTQRSNCQSRAVSRAGSTARQNEMQVVQQLSDLLRQSEPPVLEPVLRPISGKECDIEWTSPKNG